MKQLKVSRYSDEEGGLLNQSMIAVRNLSKCYGHQTVVKDVAMDIHEKSITVLLGHNGAGKSTVMGMITGKLHSFKVFSYFTILGNRNDK